MPIRPYVRPPRFASISITKLYFSRGKAPYLLLPTIPPKKQAAAKKRGRK